MIIAIPKEIMHGEDRVSASPETVAAMVKEGWTVLVEKGAGNGAFYHDEEYVKAGAELVSDVQDMYNRAELVLKVKELSLIHI